jgi:hypothetical protein
MKKILLVTAVVFMNTLIAQENWELPMKDDVVYFKFNSPEFKNKKKDLKDYYYSSQSTFNNDINLKVLSELSKKGGKYFSTTDYKMTFMSYAGTGPSPVSYSKGKMEANDTIEGMIMISTVTQNRHALHFLGDKSSNFIITGKIKVIFSKNKYDMRIKGFTVKNLSMNRSKGSVQMNDVFLEDSYKEFLSEKKKDKSVEKFYIEFKELLNSLVIIINEQLERDIKISEMD